MKYQSPQVIGVNGLWEEQTICLIAHEEALWNDGNPKKNLCIYIYTLGGEHEGKNVVWHNNVGKWFPLLYIIL